MDSSAEIIWARYALNTQKISRTQLQVCLEKQGKLKDKGKEKSLPQLLIEEGYVDAETAEEIIKLDGMLPGYIMKENIGVGGLGIVYRAYSEKLEKDVAVKILNPEYTDNTIILTRFLREVKISTAFNHKNIVKGLDFERVEDLYCLVLEYIDGVSLSSYVSEYGPMEESKVLSIAASTSNALYYAWNKGFTHRDIKPGNLMLSKGGELKVCDFGLAKLVDVNVAITLTGSIVGSPYYISPEQVNGQKTDFRSDVYSLGATLYYLATGKLMFEESSVISICNAHVNKAPTPPSEYKKIHPVLESMILKMLSKNQNIAVPPQKNI